MMTSSPRSRSSADRRRALSVGPPNSRSTEGTVIKTRMVLRALRATDIRPHTEHDNAPRAAPMGSTRLERLPQPTTELGGYLLSKRERRRQQPLANLLMQRPAHPVLERKRERLFR